MKTFNLSKKDYNTISVVIDGLEKILSFSAFRVDQGLDTCTLGLTCIGFGFSVEISIDDEITIAGNVFSGTLSQLKQSLISFVESNPNSSGEPTVQTVYSLKTTLTDAQIKSLPTTGVELVEGPGAGKMLIAHQVFVRAKFSEGGYVGTTVQDDFLRICYGSGSIISALPNNPAPVGNQFDAVFGSSADTALFLPLTNAQYNDYWTGMLAVSIGGVENYENQNFKVKMDVAGGNLTGGNSANTLEITIFYSIVDL